VLQPQDQEEERVRKKLHFFFLNPLEKYFTSKRIPWKLCLQVLKLFLVTAQICSFANYRFIHTSYCANQEVSLQHLFIKDWDQAREIQAYPPVTGKLALYSKTELIKFLDHAVSSWANIETNALAPFSRNSSLSLCVEHFSVRNITRDLTFSQAVAPVELCIHLEQKQVPRYNTSTEWMVGQNLTVLWQVMQRLQLEFNLTSRINLNHSTIHIQPECYQFQATLLLDNSDHDGQVTIHLNIKPTMVQCSPAVYRPSSLYSHFIMSFNLVIIALCLSSLCLCLRSLLRAGMLKLEMEYLLMRNYDMSLTTGEKLEFLDLWYVIICVNDCLIIGGSVFKLLLESKNASEDMWDSCSLMLGTGELLVWIGILRFLGFFKACNVLILTIKGAAPKIFRFLVCAGVVYIGFVFAGWTVLGPHNFKFASLMSSSECLFSLINGDDMYASFNIIHFRQSPLIWIYSRAYLYSFISLFIYLILSLFISIIMDTYEIIKRGGYNHLYSSR